MRWKIKQIKIPVKNGIRVREKFAFFPKNILDEFYVWLEFYAVREIFTHDSNDPKFYFWKKKDFGYVRIKDNTRVYIWKKGWDGDWNTL